MRAKRTFAAIALTAICLSIFNLPCLAGTSISISTLSRGDIIQFNGVSTWTSFDSVKSAQNHIQANRVNIYPKNRKSKFYLYSVFNQQQVLKIGKNEFLNYTQIAQSNIKVIYHKDSDGKLFKLYRQNDYTSTYPGRYKGIKKEDLPKNYTANPTISGNGCGPTSCAIVASGFGFNLSPVDLAKTGKSYSTPSSIKNFFTSNGFAAVVKKSMSDKDIIKYLKNGYKIIVLVDYDGKVGNYTCNGFQHWYSLIDIVGSKVYVADPIARRGGLFDTTSLTKRISHICVKWDNTH